MQKQLSIHQHVVPQTWLKRFAYNNKNTSVYMYDKTQDKNCGSKSIKKIAGFERFYDFHEEIFNELIKNKVFEEEDIQYVEKKFFSYNVEDKLGKLLKNIIANIDNNSNNKDVLTVEEKVSLSIHIAIQYFRSSIMRQFVIKILTSIKEYSQKYNMKNLDIDPEKEKEFFHFLLLNNSKSIQNFAIKLFERKWIIYKTKDTQPFVISDNPVVFQKMKKEAVNVIVPLSKNYLLVMHPEEFPDNIDNTLMQLNPSMASTTTQTFNNLQYQQCQNEIYASINNFKWIDKFSAINDQGLISLEKIPDKNFRNYVASIIESNTSKEIDHS